MKNITPNYCSFEQCKRLKEKGFDEYCDASFKPIDNSFQLIPSQNSVFNAITCPEQWQVVEWVFEKYKYSIEAEMNIPESGEYNGCYVFNGVIKGSEDYRLKIFYKSKDYPIREKALSDAINEFLKMI